MSGQSGGPVGSPCHGTGATLVEYFSEKANTTLYKMGPCPGCDDPGCPNKSTTIKIVKIPENEGGGYCAHVVGPNEKRLRGDGETEEEALEFLVHVMQDYKERGGK